MATKHPRGLGPLEDRGNSLTAADTHGLQGVARVSALHLGKHVHKDPHTSGANGVPDGYTAAIDVSALEAGPRKLPLTCHGQDLGGEGLIHFDQVELAETEPQPVQHSLCTGDRPD